MKFVQKEFSSILEEKKSKFIAYLIPYSDFETTMQELKQKHLKAVHHVYAYRYLNEFDQVVENCSDDGEPKGTSGKPCLNVLRGYEIINSAVIVVRYFGGIKLGTGGLVRTYSSAVNQVINESSFTTFEKRDIKELSIDYTRYSIVEYLISKWNIKVVSKNFENNVELRLEATTNIFEEFKKELPIEAVLK